MAVAYTGQPEMVNLLLSFGADDSAVDWNGMTALQLAESVGHRDAAARLRERQKKPTEEPSAYSYSSPFPDREGSVGCGCSALAPGVGSSAFGSSGGFGMRWFSASFTSTAP